MESLTEKQLSTKQVFSGVLLHVHQDEVELPDGRNSVREYIRHPGAAVMVPVLDNQEIVLERQFRYPLNREFLELPAGKIDPGEDPVESARRELLEETGYQGDNFIKLGFLHPCIGYSDEVIHIYLVNDPVYHQEQQDKDEFIETLTMPLDDALDAVRTCKISDAKSMIALLWAEKYLNGEWSPDITENV